MPMERWLTAGSSTRINGSRSWAPWRQRHGRITVDGRGDGFGGRSLCLAAAPTPERPFELAVTVQLKTKGAAGLVFCSDGANVHYGFYPSNGHLRLTRFDGPDVTSWTILHDQPSRHYVAGGWNTLRVRLEPGRMLCHVNDELVVETSDSVLAGGQAGLVTFRETHAQFRDFRIGARSPAWPSRPTSTIATGRLVENLSATGPLDGQLIARIAAEPPRSGGVLGHRAAQLEQQAAQLRKLVQAATTTAR